jgi:cell division septal protein FtsQ
MVLRKPHTSKNYYSKKAQKTQKKVLVYIGAIFGFAFLSFIFFAYCNLFAVKNIAISGNKKITTEQIQEITANYFKQKAFIPKNNLIFLNTKYLEIALNTNNFIVDSATVKKKFPNILKIIIKERPEYAIWCQDRNVDQNSSTTQDNNNQCFFTDNSGIIFQETEANNFYIISHQNSKKIGDQVMDKTNLDLIVDVKQKTKTIANIDLINADIISDNQINFKTSQGWQIYINPKKTIDIQIMALNSVLVQKLPADKRAKLEYIDLRFETISIYPNLLKEDKK